MALRIIILYKKKNRYNIILRLIRTVVRHASRPVLALLVWFIVSHFPIERQCIVFRLCFFFMDTFSGLAGT